MWKRKRNSTTAQRNWSDFQVQIISEKNPLHTLLRQICQKWKITSVPILIYLRCICNYKPDLNPCVQECLGQHDMEALECRVLTPVCFPLSSLLTKKWADSVSTSCCFVAAAAPVLPEQDKLTTLWKIFNHYDQLKKPLSPQCTEKMTTADHGVLWSIYKLWTLELAVNKLPLSWHRDSNLLACTQTPIYCPKKQELNKLNFSLVNEVSPLRKKSTCTGRERQVTDNTERF